MNFMLLNSPETTVALQPIILQICFSSGSMQKSRDIYRKLDALWHELLVSIIIRCKRDHLDPRYLATDHSKAVV